MNGQEGDYDMSYIPNPTFTGRAEYFENNDNVGAMFGDDAQVGRTIRKSQRHTLQQTQELENFFKDCPHPSDKQKSELGRMLNLETKQIRFWFQNKRTQAKMHKERHEHMIRRQQNDRLRGEQEQLKEAMLRCACNICGAPANINVQQLIEENARLKQEIEQYESVHRAPVQLPVSPSAARPPSSLKISNPGRNYAPPALGRGDETLMMSKREMLDLATVAMNEVIQLGEMSSPFWRTDSNSKRETLNFEEYRSNFNNGLMKPTGYVVDASRETGIVSMDCLALVKSFTTDKWVNVFSPLVSVATTHRLIPTGSAGPRNGSLRLIQAELQVLSPLVPKRQVKFLRYCKKLGDRLWVIVDFTPREQNLNLLPDGVSNRLPSGLIIEDMGNGSSKVTWIEQTGYDATHIHQPYKLLIGSGIGLDAKRWLTTLQRYCESLSTLSSMNLCEVYEGMTSKAATEMVKLAQRMSLNYYSAITGSSASKWETIRVENEGQYKRLMTRKNVEVIGEYTGYVLSAATSLWIPVKLQAMFDYLSNLNFRHQWDIFTYKTSIETKLHIQKSRSRGSCYVSLLQVVENDMFVLQETWKDASGALLVYAPVEADSVEEVMRGEDSGAVKILPSGFSILPDGGSEQDKPGGGCLLSLAFQILLNSKSTAQLNQDTLKRVDELMAGTIRRIKAAFSIQA